MIILLSKNRILGISSLKKCLKVNSFLVKFCSQLGHCNEQHLNGHFNKVYTEDTKLLKVAIIGTPNSGKSTLINKLVDRNVFAISKKVHTTRCQARAVGIEGNTQLVFLDTPGLVSVSESEKYKLDKTYLTGGENAIEEADVVGVVHDVSNHYTRNKLDTKVLRLLHLYQEKESFLVLNKTDTVKSKRQLLDISNSLTGGTLRNYTEPVATEKISEITIMQRIKKDPLWKYFSDVFMVSALLGEGVEDIKSYLLQSALPGKWIFERNEFTDQKPQQIIENTVRSKLLEHLPNEVPYIVNVKLQYFENEECMTAIVLIEYVASRMGKVIIGNRGIRIRKIAKEAEQSLSDTFMTNFYLKLMVTQKDSNA